MENIWGHETNEDFIRSQKNSQEVAGILYSAKYGLPTHKEMQDSLTPNTTDYMLKNRSNLYGTVDNIITNIDVLDSERTVGGVNVISAMEPADAQEYVNNRLKALDHIKDHVDKLIEKLESEVVVLLNSYETEERGP